MRTLNSLIAVVSLLLTVALVPIPGGVLFAMVTFAVFVLAVTGVLAGLDDRTVRQRNPELNPTKWRDDS
jgi:hypothetical protein